MSDATTNLSPQRCTECAHARLLAEVERQRAEIERLRALLEAVRVDESEDGGVWITLSLPSSQTTVASHLGNRERLTGTVALMFDDERRKALEGKP